MVETDNRHCVKLLPTTQRADGESAAERKDMRLFRAILNKRSADNMESSGDGDQVESDVTMRRLQQEKRKHSVLTEDIALTEHQQRQHRERQMLSSLSSTPRHKKQRIHSMLALFYFMPISWLTATVRFLKFADF